MSTFYTNTASIDNLIVTSSAILSGSVTVYGSLTATASLAISSSYATTASYILQAVSSSFASTASFFSGTVTSASYAQTATTASYSSQEFVNVETLSANKTLTINDKPIQIFKISGASKTITLPTTGVPDGFKFEIWNNSAVTNASYLTITPSVDQYVTSQCKVTLRYDSTISKYVGEYNTAISIGGITYDNYEYGVGIGEGSYNNNNTGVGIGRESRNNYNVGVGIGGSAHTNYSGVGVGYNASNNYTFGLGLGRASTNNYNYGVGVGASATTNGKGTDTVAIGSYSKAERQNEFVTTATDSTTNQAQSIIQKFRNKALATAGGAFQEIFTDASSGRLTIFASSIYQFRIQINAIEATGFKCKTWEITGGITRNGSSVTTMVGGTPTYYITSEDSGTGNWDVKVSADDTNEALKIEVKHDSANNVTFSATVWATETRL